MTDQSLILKQLSDASLCAVSGTKIFERGVTYARSGGVCVTDETVNPPAITAEVQGTERYVVRASLHKNKLSCDCSCPHAEDGWFCKHQVALALVWRDRLNGVIPIMDAAAAKKLQTAAKRAQTIRDKRASLENFLRSQSVQALADKLMSLADMDRDLERELHIWRKTSQTHLSAEDMKSLITECLSIGREFLPWSTITAWTQHASRVLPLLQKLRKQDAQAAINLCMYALRKGWQALQQADDSNGEIGDLCESIGSEWLLSLRQAGKQPAAFGDTYLKLRLEDPFRCFDNQAAEQAMGAAALTRYRESLCKQWRAAKDQVLARKAEGRAKLGNQRHADLAWMSIDPLNSSLSQLERLHLEQLEQQGDINSMLTVMREDLSEPQHFSAVTRLLEKHKRHREALANAEAACKQFADDRHLQEELLVIYERDGWTDQVYELRQKQFDDHPDLARYQALLKAAKAAKKDTVALRELIIERLAVLELSAMNAVSGSGYLSGRATARNRDVSLRTQILLSEGKLPEALTLVQPPAVCNVAVLHELALSLKKPHHEQAVSLLMRIFNLEMPMAQTPYRSVLTLVEQIVERMNTRQRQQWLEQLRIQYKAKRNFVRDLPSH